MIGQKKLHENKTSDAKVYIIAHPHSFRVIFSCSTALALSQKLMLRQLHVIDVLKGV
jgi:hypothetical protein